MRLIEVTSFRREQGLCWVVSLPTFLATGDQAGLPPKSVLRLFEDGVELGPGSAAHDLVREQGAGAFSDRKSTRLNSSHIQKSRMPSSA